MNHEEHDDLWQLLGKAKTTSASPFFSRNVLRALRQENQKPASLWAWLRFRWQWASLGVILLGLGAFELRQAGPAQDPLGAIAQAVSSSPDYPVIIELDELLAYEENSVWLDSPGY